MKGGNMDYQLYQAECAPDCGFMVRSPDKQEVVEDTKKHAAEKHGEADMPDEQIEELVSVVTTI